jgi:molybdopterin converting factor subunit 1
VKIRLLAFASAADLVGAGESEIEVPEGSTVGDLLAELARRHPALAPLAPRLAVALDGEIARGERALRPGVEVALLPPVSGG